jgi:hypothetical protein
MQVILSHLSHEVSCFPLGYLAFSNIETIRRETKIVSEAISLLDTAYIAQTTAAFDYSRKFRALSKGKGF